jgi:hypothetical protein
MKEWISDVAEKRDEIVGRQSPSLIFYLKKGVIRVSGVHKSILCGKTRKGVFL